jgi:hypothetical protein
MTMKYLMLVYGNDEIWSSGDPGDFPKLVANVDAFNQALHDSGEMVSVEGLVPRPQAIRLSGGAPVVTDGPYLEAKEHVGSYTLIDVESEERALEIARSYPGIGLGGGLEMWPVMVHGGADV